MKRFTRHGLLGQASLLVLLGAAIGLASIPLARAADEVTQDRLLNVDKLAPSSQELLGYPILQPQGHQQG